MTTEDTNRQSRRKDGGKVVCIDDAYQRRDRVSTPEGLLVRGQVYCVAGISMCGGVLLTGLRAISLRSGKDIGFDPSRFLTLEQHLQFPGGLASIPEHGLDLSYLEDEESWRSKKWGKVPEEIEISEIDGLLETKPLITRALSVGGNGHHAGSTHRHKFSGGENDAIQGVRTGLRISIGQRIAPVPVVQRGGKRGETE